MLFRSVAWALCGNAPFPVPAHQTGRADFPHPAFRLVSARGTRRRPECGACCGSSERWQTRPATPIGVRLRRRVKLLQKRPDAQGCSRLIANHRSSTSLQAYQKSGPFPPPALPGLTGTMTLSDSRRHRRPWRRRGRDPRAKRASPDDPRHPSGVPCPLPRWTAAGASVGCFPATCSLPRNSGGSASTTSLSRPAQASLTLRPVGSLNRPRRPSSQRFGLPGCPDRPLVSYQIKPTTIWVEPPSTGDARHLGALNYPG